MRLIREQRNVSREVLHHRTKIALENIELFEAGELDQHFHFNEVYLRALVRAYADVLDISTERALQALERSRAGTYDGAFGDAYLEREEPPPTDASGSKLAGLSSDRGSEDAVEPTDEPDESSNDAARRTGGDEPDRGDVEGYDAEDDGGDDAEDAEEEVATEDVDRSAGFADGVRLREGQKGKASDALNADTAEPSGRSHSRGEDVDLSASYADASPRRGTASQGKRQGTLSGTMMRRIVWGAVFVVSAIAAVWAVNAIFAGSGSSSAIGDSAQGTASDTAAGTNAATGAPAPPPVATIGDSLDFTVIAVNDKLEPVRVRLDEEDWNPYWVELGDSISFAVEESFAVRDYLSRVRLRVESLEWPIASRGRYDTVVVSRAQVQEHIDSLSVSGGR